VDAHLHQVGAAGLRPVPDGRQRGADVTARVDEQGDALGAHASGL
jgi:hypothetical protein